jgi:hypothetical protein
MGDGVNTTEATGEQTGQRWESDGEAVKSRQK